jgi:hypothetical protein
MSLPSKKITIKLFDNSYEIQFPKNKELIKLERMKIEWSGGNQTQMLYGAASAGLASVLIEALCTFTVLVPKLIEDLQGVKTLFDLDPHESRELLDQYEKVYYPWFSEWMNIINAPVDEKK